LKIKEKRDIKTEEIINIFQGDDSHFNYINYLLMQSELRKDSGMDIGEEIHICLKEKDNMSVKSEQKKISKEIKELEKKGDFEQIKVLLEKFNKLSQNKNE
jgi:hypothetical protein